MMATQSGSLRTQSLAVVAVTVIGSKADTLPCLATGKTPDPRSRQNAAAEVGAGTIL